MTLPYGSRTIRPARAPCNTTTRGRRKGSRGRRIRLSSPLEAATVDLARLTGDTNALLTLVMCGRRRIDQPPGEAISHDHEREGIRVAGHRRSATGRARN